MKNTLYNPHLMVIICCRYHNVDRFFLFFSPLLFLIFNMIYWTYFQVLLNIAFIDCDFKLWSWRKRTRSWNLCFRFGTSGVDPSSWTNPPKAKTCWQGCFYTIYSLFKWEAIVASNMEHCVYIPIEGILFRIFSKSEMVPPSNMWHDQKPFLFNPNFILHKVCDPKKR